MSKNLKEVKGATEYLWQVGVRGKETARAKAPRYVTLARHREKQRGRCGRSKLGEGETGGGEGREETAGGSGLRGQREGLGLLLLVRWEPWKVLSERGM